MLFPSFPLKSLCKYLHLSVSESLTVRASIFSCLFRHLNIDGLKLHNLQIFPHQEIKIYNILRPLGHLAEGRMCWTLYNETNLFYYHCLLFLLFSCKILRNLVMTKIELLDRYSDLKIIYYLIVKTFNAMTSFCSWEFMSIYQCYLYSKKSNVSYKKIHTTYKNPQIK